MNRPLISLLSLLAAAGLYAPVAAAQAVEVPLDEVEEVARFIGAEALAVDAVGSLYVVDGDGATVTKFDSLGLPVAVWGGPGSGDYELDGPADLDPTNGLTLVVADAGNQVVKRYSGEFVHLGAVSMDLTAATAGLGNSGQGNTDLLSVDEGRPIAVAVAINGSMFAIDETQGVVVKWDSNLRLERVFGGYDAGEGALSEPVALALGPNETVMVADRGRRAVVVFDRFGNFVRTIADGQARGIRALALHQNRLLIVLPVRILVYHLAGGLEQAYTVSLGEPLVDVAVANRKLYLLTPTRLLQTLL